MTTKKKVRMRATWTVEYDADPKSYPGAVTPEQMAAIDARNDAFEFIEMFQGAKVAFEVKPA